MRQWIQRGMPGVVLLLMQSSAFAEIYTWKDSNGVINFSGQPSEQGADKVEARHIPTYTRPDIERKHQQERVSEVLEYERRSREQKFAQQNEQRRREEAACTHATRQLSSYLQAGYMYEKDEHGNKRILDHEERALATDDARREMERLCNR